MFLFSLLPYKFGWADVELFFKMFGEYLGGVIPQGICNFRNLHLAFCQELLCTFHTDMVLMNSMGFFPVILIIFL